MKRQRGVILGVMATIAGLAVWVAVGRLPQAPAQAARPVTPAALMRSEDPVVMTGAQAPDLLGAPLTDLKGYRYLDGAWTALPFQIDERDADNVLVAFEDGVLDANDQIVFMGDDVGEAVGPDVWVADEEAQSHPRQRVWVTDPLDAAGQGYIYIYRSTTLAPSAVRYVTWDTPSQTMTTTHFVAQFADGDFVGLESLYLNGVDVDILDRQKSYVQAEICLTIFCDTREFNEESISDSEFLTESLEIDWTIVGPVRAAGDAGFVVGAGYRSSFDLTVEVDLGDIDIPGLQVDFLDVRTSFDLADPTLTGFGPAAYYSNLEPAGLPIDGTPDNVPATPLVDWFQISGGWGGFFIGLPVGLNAPASVPGELQNWYIDDSTLDPADTGDQRSFGNAGLRIDDPIGLLRQRVIAYILPAGSGNVGDSYFQRALSPLQASVTTEMYTPPTATPSPTATLTPTPSPTPIPTPPGVYLPLLRKP